MLSPDIPPETLQTLLNIAEFMELCEKPLPIGIKYCKRRAALLCSVDSSFSYRTLATLAEKCHAYAKTLRYLESEFANSPASSSIIEALITVNDMLQQPEAAIGVIVYVQKGTALSTWPSVLITNSSNFETAHKVELKESWYEKLQRWEVSSSVFSCS